MRRSWGFGDLLPNLFERMGATKTHDDTRSLPELSEALLSAEGEVSGYKLAATVLVRYQSASDVERLAFFDYLNTHLDLDAEHLAALAHEYAKTPSPEVYQSLTQAAEPRRQELLRRLNQPVGATQSLVAMRTDLSRFIKTNPELARTDQDFVHLLRSWFNRGFLMLEQINWSTPAAILDKIVAYEAVHQIDDFEALRRRLAPPDRRCFAFFHPSMPAEPLIFVEVALTSGIPGSVADLLREDRNPIAADAATTATFYSISNCQKGLAGISFGNLLIKQVVSELSLELPNLKTFVTLSPIPGLSAWLSKKTDDEALQMANEDAQAGNASDETLRSLAARYLLTAKTSDGRLRDPVARFHLGNGAEVYQIHVGADPSENGMSQSYGTMVNYLYDLSRTEQNHEAFASRGLVAASREVEALLSAEIQPTRKGKVA
ncbi:MAG: malonyl-CoA decarboxylase family protein [Pseudomonadota bacterium]